MAIQIRELAIPPITRLNRATRTLQLPTGATVLGVFQPEGGGAVLVAKGDPAQPPQDRSFAIVRAGVPLAQEENAGTYVGSFVTYRTESGPEVYHLLAI